MPEHTVGTQEEWKAERDKLLAEEKELTHRGDELTKKRQELPWVAVEKDYEFETTDGTKSLRDLFDGRSQLLIYHFMFGPTWSAGCPVCSSIADNIAAEGPAPECPRHDRDVRLSSPGRQAAGLQEADGLGYRLGVNRDDDFNRDLGFFYTEEELKPFLESGEMPPTVPQNAELCGTDVAGYVAEGPGLSVYALDDGTVYRTYVTTSRGLEGPAMAFYALLDRTPKGRNEPPDKPLWIRRHDEYGTS